MNNVRLYWCWDKAVKSARLAMNPPLSRMQTYYLILPLADGLTSFTGIYFAPFGMSAQLCRIYTSYLQNGGYAVRIKRGHYQITDKGIQLYNNILSRFAQYQAEPFRWR